MMNQTTLNLTINGISATVSYTHSDVDMQELLQAFYSICIAHTFIPCTVIDGMKEFVEDNVININD